MPISTDYQETLSDAYASALRRAVANNPSATAKELSELVAEHPQLGSVTLAEMLGEEGGKRRAKGKKKKAKTARKGKSKSKSKSKWNVRTEEGREALRAAVLEGLRDLGGSGVRAEQLRKRIGATPAQLRTMLNRLIEEGLLTYTGKARGTRYTLTG